MRNTKYLAEGGDMRGLRVFALAILLAAILMAGIHVTPTFAAAPGTGVVVEGESVPGVALGSTRAKVEAAFGAPRYCQSVESAGDMAACSFEVEGGGQVDVRYRGADGGTASNSADDVAYHFRWSQQVSGWTTTAGVNTTLALENPEAVMAAYPNATVIYNPTFGNIESIEDKNLGILIDYHFHYLSGTITVSMGISFPSTPTPPQEKFVRVTAIDLSVDKRAVSAKVHVQDDLGSNLSGVTVLATWTLPRNGTLTVYGISDGSGVVQFDVKKARQGTYTLDIVDVDLFGYTYDRDGSVLRASITK